MFTFKSPEDNGLQLITTKSAVVAQSFGANLLSAQNQDKTNWSFADSRRRPPADVCSVGSWWPKRRRNLDTNSLPLSLSLCCRDTLISIWVWFLSVSVLVAGIYSYPQLLLASVPLLLLLLLVLLLLSTTIIPIITHPPICCCWTTPQWRTAKRWTARAEKWSSATMEPGYEFVGNCKMMII